jgi:hypothetical protein
MKSKTSPFSFDRQKALLLGLVCLVIIGATDWIINSYAWLGAKSDFYARWYAVDRLYSEGRNLYDPRNGDEVDRIVQGPDAIDTGMDFYYPAHILLVIGPLGLLSYETANLLWLFAIQLFYIAGLAIMMWLRKWPPTINQATAFLLAALIAVPTFQHTIWGQFNTIGIFALALTYLAIHRQRYGLAGLFAVGLTFKPQAQLLAFVFLMLWALSDRKRWRFLFGFGAAAFLAWGVTELLQPGWVVDFFHSLNRYSDLAAVVDLFWNPSRVLTGGFILVALIIFWRNRRAEVQSWAFDGTLAISLALWYIAFPLAWTFHTLMLVLAIVLVASHYQHFQPRLYRLILLALAVLYGAGWIGVALRMTNEFALWAYIIVLPLLITLAALPLCLKSPVSGTAEAT